MKKKCLTPGFVAILIFLANMTYGQEARYSSFETWENLATVSYEITEDAYGEVNVPVFNDKIKAMEGQEVVVPGYMVPADGLNGVFQPKHFILSSLPLSACFFCGTGGAESVIEVYAEEPVEYTEEPVQLRGTLVLNAHDTYQLMYILEDAEYLGKIE